MTVDLGNGQDGGGPTGGRWHEVVQGANVPTLLALLVHLTGDLSWLEDTFAPSRSRGMSDNDSGGLAPEVQEEVRSAAADAIGAWAGGKPIGLTDPTPELLVRILSFVLGEPVPDSYGDMIAHELAAVQPPQTGSATSETKRTERTERTERRDRPEHGSKIVTQAAVSTYLATCIHTRLPRTIGRSTSRCVTRFINTSNPLQTPSMYAHEFGLAPPSCEPIGTRPPPNGSSKRCRILVSLRRYERTC
jgi:hypothetical protein